MSSSCPLLHEVSPAPWLTHIFPGPMWALKAKETRSHVPLFMKLAQCLTAEKTQQTHILECSKMHSRYSHIHYVLSQVSESLAVPESVMYKLCGLEHILRFSVFSFSPFKQKYLLGCCEDQVIITGMGRFSNAGHTEVLNDSAKCLCFLTVGPGLPGWGGRCPHLGKAAAVE